MIGKIPSLKQVADAVGRATGTDPREMYGTSRKFAPTFARHLLWFVACTHCGRSHHSVAVAMGRDHTTVRAGVIRIGKRRMWDERTQLLAETAIAFLTAQQNGQPAPPPLTPVEIKGPICSPQWWATNDANFRAGVARAVRDAKAAKLAAFVHMGKSVEKLKFVDAGRKSPLALPRNLCAGLQSPTPDLMITQGP